ncbi:MAG: glycosyltransferase, partial [Candidatus Omnitrophica bacterium]|nr:glycosyltransferase [Candidatus Omnitrophota bacterium]
TFWGLGYFLTDNYYVHLLVAKLRRLNNWANSGRFRRYLVETRPDVIVSTHFFASEIISRMKEKGEIQSRLITVVTDYRLHSWWVAPRTDMYVVAGEAAKEDLLRWKQDPDRIKVLGIPVEPVFSKSVDKSTILAKLGLREGVFTVMNIGGGFGLGPIESIVKVIDSISKPVQIIAICGHNKDLIKRVEGLKAGLKNHLTVLGFINNVNEYMAISDVLISKSGGITSTESLASGLPLIIVFPIIGQETRNSDFLTSSGAAIKIDKLDQLRKVLEDLATHPDKLKKMREDIKKIARPRACYDIAKLALEMCGGN